jgi:hypothetical protein
LYIYMYMCIYIYTYTYTYIYIYIYIWIYDSGCIYYDGGGAGNEICVENVCESFTHATYCNNAQDPTNYPNGIINIIS